MLFNGSEPPRQLFSKGIVRQVSDSHPKFFGKTGVAIAKQRSATSLVRTEDGGHTWKTMGFIPVANFRAYGADFISPDVGVVVGDEWSAGIGHIIRTEDGGKTWQVQVNTHFKGFLDAVFVNAQKGWVVARDGSIFHTEDGGKTWQQTTPIFGISLSGTLLFGISLGAIEYDGQKTLWAAGEWEVILKYSDESLENGRVVPVEPQSQKLLTWAEVKQDMLLPIYPNPANPEVWIPYRLTTVQEVKIDIYDAMGRIIRHLDLGYKSPGDYIAPASAAYWDGRNQQGEAMASGLYFIRFSAGEFTEVKRVVIRK